MLNFIAQAGSATATVDFTNEFSGLLAVLIGLVWLSAGMIAFMAVREWLNAKPQIVADEMPEIADYRQAA
jgi:hypothetical protein